MDNIRSYLNWIKGYYEINREERNLAAIFYHVLLLNDNLTKFLGTISCKFSIKPEEVGIYFEYSYLRDLWFNIKNEKRVIEEDNRVKREIIHRFLRPSNIDELKLMSTHEFNGYFGAVPIVSDEYIQSPGNWSIGKYQRNIKDNIEFLKVCKFKWAFNAKPDIVIHTSHDSAICIECKFESDEAQYPTNPSEIKEFKDRGLKRVTQTSLQKYMMEDLLGIRTQFVFLVQKEAAESETHTKLTWKQAFSNLSRDGCPFFIREWIERL